MRNKKFGIGKFEHFSRVDRVTSNRVTFCGKEFTVENDFPKLPNVQLYYKRGTDTGVFL